MKVSEALDILKDLVERGHGEDKLSVFANGVHNTTGLLFYPVGELSELQTSKPSFAKRGRAATRDATNTEKQIADEALLNGEVAF